ncbi:aminotransferase class I/II-fold pyridoxal phosphate-dependent enzyme [Pseudodesulfovibrio sp. F-1]|uniref:Aminotransferase class I/II-fold pyridoxal phosphate-dependent enzyme n=1 Tax=Pseudodesulfovibrio alkaliphilus TaxID=2661613 RepID=A0A7K1KNI9_9BACT|nr:DegT/DnrJ/EryC1/StrS family aminotransferase [Pseudodesulfovibrio alkaliphilus]MUM77462.1 aminotransferase class I/II-fold pyridoxal phosphate-dependent enzyme [Pseudodesulfovibrio alkaliphilus]
MPVRSKENFLIFGSPRIEQDEIDEVVASMEVGWLGTGPKVARFEREFSAYVGAPHAAACNSCTAALHLALVALGLKPGDEVITTPLTFCASVNAIIHAGCTPVLADIDPSTQNIDPERIREKITSRTRAILPVHFAGRSCDMDAIMAIAAEHSLKVVEDCAHAIETTWKGRHAGTFGDFGCFSFYVTKNVCTGEGGMVVAAGEDAIRHVKVLGLHGMSADAWKRFSDEGYKHYQVVEAGFKYNMMDLQAAIGIHQLARVEDYFVRRCEIWNRYQAALADLPLTLPAPEEPDTRHARHLYTVLVDPAACGVERDDFLMRVTREGIGVGVHYLSIPEQPYYRQRFGWTLDDTPHAVRIGRQTVSLPLSAKLTDGDVADVIEAVKRSLGA